MTTENGTDRRQHPRYEGGSRYRVFGADSKETALATNQGPGGAFLPVSKPLPDGTQLILDIHDPEAVHRGPPVILVAEVMYTKQVPVLGVGIRWKHAFCLEGHDRLAQFLETHFNLFLDPKKIGAFHKAQLDGPIQYDFHFGTVKPVPSEVVEKWHTEQKVNDIQYPQTFMAKADLIVTRAKTTGLEPAGAKAPASLPETGRDELEIGADWDGPEITFADGVPSDETPEASSSTSPEPPPKASEPSPKSPEPPPEKDSVDDAEEATDLGFDDFTQETPSTEVGELTSELGEWASDMRQRMRVKVPVLILPMVGDETFGGTVRMLSRTNLFVLVDDVGVYRGDRIVVRFPLSLGPLSVKLIFVGTVVRLARDKKSGSLGLDMTIDSVDEGQNNGIFKEFATALRRRAYKD